MGKSKSVIAQARVWATKKKLFGPQAFLRYVILSFAENLNQVSDDFVFKGGNLLWVYIATPRATVDLDLVTLKSNSHTQVRRSFEKACQIESQLVFSVHSFKEIEKEEHLCAEVSIAYSTELGASNRFEVDIVYALKTDNHEIASPVHEEIKLRSATIENIILDKVRACHRFKSANTRMKDFDDLWRLSQSLVNVDTKKLYRLLKSEKLSAELDPGWINPELIRIWKRHRIQYLDLPEDLKDLFVTVNRWLDE